MGPNQVFQSKIEGEAQIKGVKNPIIDGEARVEGRVREKTEEGSGEGAR